MKYTAILAGAALTQLAQAAIHPNQHGRIHKRHFNKRDTVTSTSTESTTIVTETDIVTDLVIVTVTVYGPAPAPASDLSSTAVSSDVAPTVIAPAESSASSPAAVPSAVAPGAYSQASSSSPVAASTDAPSASSASYSAPASSAAPLTVDTSAATSSSASAVAPIASSSSVQSQAPSSSSGSASTGVISKTSLTPRGKKAGLSGFVGIQENAASAFAALAPYISWYSDYTATTPTSSAFPDVVGVGMLWGAQGSACTDVVAPRLKAFSADVVTAAPDIMFGFYEPDCACTMSSEMEVAAAATQWDLLIAPLAAKGTVLGSPSMCKQKDEDFLTPFNASISTTWDVTSIHINKPDLAGVKEDVEYYASTYGKPIWVSEFACVNDQDGFTPCTDQDTINTFINEVVPYFESNSDIVAYGASNGEGLDGVWPLTTSSGDLSTTGQTYLNAIKGY